MENLTWRKSARSANGGNTCVECARTPQSVAVRDSKDKSGPQIRITTREWSRFLDGIKSGTYDM